VSGLRAAWQRRRGDRAAARAERAAARAERAAGELVTAVVLHTDAEARLAAGALEAAGIPAQVQLDQPGSGAGFVEAARVIVRRRDLEQAQALLNDDRDDRDDR